MRRTTELSSSDLLRRAWIVFSAQGGVALDKTAEGRDFLKKYKATYKTDTQVYAVNYHDRVKMLADASVRCSWGA